MDIVPHHHHSCESFSSKFLQFCMEFHVSQILRSCNAYKMRGFSYLKLGKETRAISYDALTAHTSIVFTRYMMLALAQRSNVDERSIGELFFLTIDELDDLHYLDALAMLLKLLMYCARDTEILDEEQLNQLLNPFLAKLPNLWQRCLKQCA